MGLVSRIGSIFRRKTPTERNDKSVGRLKKLPPRQRGDAWRNILTAIGTQMDKRTAGEFQCIPIDNLEARELWRGDDIAKRVIELRPRDRMRRGFDVKLGGMEDGKEKSEDVMAVLEHMHFNRKFVMAGQQEGAYGGSALFPVINDGEKDLSLPLNEDKITVPTAIHVFEPRMLQPVDWTDDPMDDNFAKPSVWRLVPIGVRGNAFTGMTIHHTRMVIFPGIRVSIEQPIGAQMGWGDCILTPMRDVLRDYNLSWSSAIALLQDMAQGVFKMSGLAQLVSADRDDEVERRIMIMDAMRSMIRSMVIDKDDDFSRIQTPMTGMPEILQQFCTRLAAAADMPVTKLMGQSPAGMNATGESDITIYDDSVEAWGDEHMPQLERAVRLCGILPQDGPLGGQEPENWSCEYRPLRQPTEAEDAALRKTVAETDQMNILNEIYTPSDAAKSHYGGDTFSPDIQIDWAAREAQEKALEDAAAESLAAQQEAAASGTGDPSMAPVLLNGAQISSLLEIVTAAASGQIPRESAAVMIRIGLGFSQPDAEAAVGPAGFVPAAAPGDAAGIRQPVQEPPIEAPQQDQSTDNGQPVDAQPTS